MKRAELTAGTIYATSASNDWTGPWYGRATPARVLDTGAWYTPQRGWATRSPEANGQKLTDGSTVTTTARRTYDDKGQNVLVQPLNDDLEPKGEPIPMATREIRATWEEGKAALAAADAARDADRLRREATLDAANELHGRLKLATPAGVHLPHFGQGAGGHYYYQISQEAMAALLGVEVQP